MTLRNKVIHPHSEAELGRQPSSGPARQGESHPFQSTVEPRGEPSVRGSQLGERLGERPARAVCRPTDETPDRQSDHKALMSEREVIEPALVTIVDSIREEAAVRTYHRDRATSRHHLDRAERGRNRFDLHLVDPLEHQ